MEVDLAGRVAVVAGPDGGLRQAIAERLLASGATVETAAEHRVEDLAASLDRHGRVDILVNVGAPSGRRCRKRHCRHLPPGGRSHRRARRPDSQRRLGARRHPGARRSRSLRRRGRHPVADPRLRPRMRTARHPRQCARRRCAGGGRPARCPASDPCPACEAAELGEIADAALFLLDPENSYTTGHVLVVDGGWTAGYARNF